MNRASELPGRPRGRDTKAKFTKVLGGSQGIEENSLKRAHGTGGKMRGKGASSVGDYEGVCLSFRPLKSLFPISELPLFGFGGGANTWRFDGRLCATKAINNIKRKRVPQEGGNCENFVPCRGLGLLKKILTHPLLFQKRWDYFIFVLLFFAVFEVRIWRSPLAASLSSLLCTALRSSTELSADGVNAFSRLRSSIFLPLFCTRRFSESRTRRIAPLCCGIV